MSVSVKVQRIHPEASLPEYQTMAAAGADVRACLTDDIVIKPGERVLVSTGLSLEVPDNHEIQVRPRSGLALKHGIGLVNSPGTIDADYRGELKIILVNWGTEDFQVRHGERIAQIVVAPVLRANFISVDQLASSERGDRGFGSTGV